jgi:hypothetical protein
LFWTVQPPRVKFNPPMRIEIPNTAGLPAGTVTEIFCYNHDLEEFGSGGTARVSEDGSLIVSDTGSGVIVSGWGAAPPPPPPNTNAKHDSCKDVTDQLQQMADNSGPNDPTSTFERIQVCIARAACDPNSGISDPKINDVVADFIQRFLNQNGGWPGVLAQCAGLKAAAQQCLDPKSGVCIPQAIAIDACSTLMAHEHITQDLTAALEENTCFNSDSDWDKIHDLVQNCTKQELGSFQAFIANLAVSSWRDDARNTCFCSKGLFHCQPLLANLGILETPTIAQNYSPDIDRAVRQITRGESGRYEAGFTTASCK